MFQMVATSMNGRARPALRYPGAGVCARDSRDRKAERMMIRMQSEIYGDFPLGPDFRWRGYGRLSLLAFGGSIYLSLIDWHVWLACCGKTCSQFSGWWANPHSVQWSLWAGFALLAPAAIIPFVCAVFANRRRAALTLLALYAIAQSVGLSLSQEQNIAMLAQVTVVLFVIGLYAACFRQTALTVLGLLVLGHAIDIVRPVAGAEHLHYGSRSYDLLWLFVTAVVLVGLFSIPARFRQKGGPEAALIDLPSEGDIEGQALVDRGRERLLNFAACGIWAWAVIVPTSPGSELALMGLGLSMATWARMLSLSRRTEYLIVENAIAATDLIIREVRTSRDIEDRSWSQEKSRCTWRRSVARSGRERRSTTE